MRLEIIHVRLAGPRLLGMLAKIRRSMASDGEAMQMAIYHNATVPGDLAIHLRWSGEPPAPDQGSPSEPGVRLAAALKEHGMVEHTVWMEETEVTSAGAE